MLVRDMTFEEIKALVYDYPDAAKEHASEIKDKLADLAWAIGLTWDRLEDVDPSKGKPTRFGTPNRKSMTYKLRKAARYSYP